MYVRNIANNKLNIRRDMWAVTENLTQLGPSGVPYRMYCNL
jgi:hypothetical protein